MNKKLDDLLKSAQWHKVVTESTRTPRTHQSSAITLSGTMFPDTQTVKHTSKLKQNIHRIKTMLNKNEDQKQVCTKRAQALYCIKEFQYLVQ